MADAKAKKEGVVVEHTTDKVETEEEIQASLDADKARVRAIQDVTGPFQQKSRKANNAK